MAWLMARIYDRFMAASEEACLRAWRAELLAGAEGRVLEIGAGTGANLPHYPGAVTELVVTEPDPHMRALLDAKNEGRAVRIVPDAVGRLSLPDASFDTVVSTLVMCSVDDPDAALADVRRVLRPGGKLVFLEHVAADDGTSRYRWQRRVEPIWKHLAGGCHVTRRTELSIERAGFTLASLERDSMRKALPWVRPTIRGVAVRP